MTSPPPGIAVDWIAAFPPPRSLPLDQEALRIYERAYYIGLETEENGLPPVTFTTVMAALLLGEDEASRWFAQHAADLGPNRVAVFEEKKISDAIRQRSAQRPGPPSQPRLSADKHLLTASARAVLENAEGWAQRVGGSDIGVRHLVASYLLNPPPNHRRQLQEWQVKESLWRPLFFDWVANRFTWEQWTDASQRPAPTRGLPAFEQPEVKASLLAWPGDPIAMRILERAAEDHARRNDPWLRLLTVFYALGEAARDDTTVRTTVMPVWEAIQAVETRYRQKLADYYASPTAPHSAAVPFADLNISPRVLNALETARELAAAASARHSMRTGDEVTVGALHLAGALLSRRVDADGELAALGLDPQGLRVSVVRHAEQGGESGEIWREMLGEEETLLAGRPVDLNSDEPEAVVRHDEEWKSDPLAIRPDVEAFAALLASRNLEPPLSIGLFGPWGSGKTTFLKRLRRAVERRTTEARQSGVSPLQAAYVSNVVHVEFNAWHFAEGALISSLVDAVLRALSAFIKDEQPVAGKTWAEQKRAALETTRRKVEAATAIAAAAQVAVTAADSDLAVKRKTAAARATQLHTAIEIAWATAKAQLRQSKDVKDSGVLDAIGDTVKSADELRARLDAVRTRPARLLADLGWPQAIVFAGLVLAVPPLIGWLVGKFLQTSQVGQLLSSMAALLSLAGLWVRAASRAVTAVDQAVTKVADEYDRQVATAPKVKEAQEALAAAHATAETAATALQAARAELARAQADAANATLPAQMLQLVSNRIDSLAYTKELTSLSLARADLEALSRVLRDQRDEATASTATARAVDRVILYIDDLDRCKPEDVVRVLQLVHMLLAFELFVVVVAVDARWVEEALRQSYHWLAKNDDGLTDGGEEQRDPSTHHGGGLVTPQDYLEKIFQIAFWLEPMTASRAASYLASLVRAPRTDAKPLTAAPPVAEAESQGSGPLTGKVEIAAIELDYMRALAAYVGPSPRRVKRLVNAYRLIKARLSDAQLAGFVTDRASDGGGLRSGPYQIVIGLLVIGTGAQSAGTHIIEELAEWDPKETFEDVSERFRSRSHPDWDMAAQVIDTLMRTQKAKDVSELRGWARKVSRFLLHSPSAGLRATGTAPKATDLAGAGALSAPDKPAATTADPPE